MDGIILVNKDKNMTSRDVVNRICKIFNTKKVGHTGTLDPMATGVLAIAINKGLKVVDEITSYDKEYEAEITLGIKTDTLDITGNILDEKKVNIKKEEIDNVLETFIGDYHMKVPEYSAIKINGKKLYEYARNNEIIDIPYRNVNIYSINRISDIKENNGKICFNIKCKVSKGTYIRSLVRDIASRLGTIGVMSSLNRVKQGNFDIKDSYKLNDIENGKYRLLSIKEVLDMPFVEVPKNIEKLVKNGNKITKINEYDEFCFVIDNNPIAIYVKDPKNVNLIRPKKVF